MLRLCARTATVKGVLAQSHRFRAWVLAVRIQTSQCLAMRWHTGAHARCGPGERLAAEADEKIQLLALPVEMQSGVISVAKVRPTPG